MAEKDSALNNAKAVLAKIEAEEAAKQAVEKAAKEAKKAAEEKAENTNFYKAGHKLVDAKGNVMSSNYSVKGTKVYSPKGEFVGVVSDKVQSRVVAHTIAKVEAKTNSSIVSSSNAISTYNSKHESVHQVKASSVLPTTGNTNNNLVGMVGLAIASVGSLLGLASSRKEKQR